MTEPSVTYPATFIPSKLAAGEEYATVEQILRCSDLPTSVLHIPHWRIDGKPVAILVRGLSLQERDQAQRETDLVAQYCLIWHFGCVMPAFTLAQANGLAEKNAFAVEQGANFILRRGAINQEWVEYYVALQTNAPAAAADSERGAAADPAHRAPTRRVDRPTRPKVRTPARRAAQDA